MLHQPMAKEGPLMGHSLTALLYIYIYIYIDIHADEQLCLEEIDGSLFSQSPPLLLFLGTPEPTE
jgi:hypothetical protein